MLDPWIIEEIRRREREERQHRDERPVLEIPLDRPTFPDRPSFPSDTPREPGEGGGQKNPDRGVVIIDFRI